MEKVAIFAVLAIVITSVAALYILGPSITGMFIGYGQPMNATWWNTSWTYRMKIDINSTQYSRTDWPVELEINFTDLLPSGTFDINSTRVIEYSQSGLFIQEVPNQFDQGDNFDTSSNALGTVVFSMNGTTSANANRTFYVYYDSIENGAKAYKTYSTNLTYDHNLTQQTISVNNNMLNFFIDTNRGENTSGLYRVEQPPGFVVITSGGSDRTGEYLDYSNGTHNLTFDLINNATFTNGSVRLTVEQNGDEIVFGSPSQTTNEVSVIKKYYVYNRAGPEIRGTFIKIKQRITNDAGYQIQRNSTLSGALALDLNRTLSSGYISDQDADTNNPYSWAWTSGDGGEVVGIVNLEQTGTSNYYTNNNSYTNGRIGIQLNDTSISSGSYIEQTSLVFFAPIGGSDAVTDFLNIKNRFVNPIAISQSLPERWYVLITPTTNATIYNRNESALIRGNVSTGDPYNLTEYMNATLDMGTIGTGDDQSIILYDDGTHDDGGSGDRIFANNFEIPNNANLTVWTINFTTYTNTSDFLNSTTNNFNVTDIFNVTVNITNDKPETGETVFANVYVKNYLQSEDIVGATINCSYDSTEVTNKTDLNNGTYAVNFSAPSIGDYNLYCNATKDGNFGNNSDNFTSEAGATTINITTQPSEVTVTNVTLYNNDSFITTSNATNIGNGTAYYSNMTLELLAGWDANETLEQCGDINKYEFCVKSFNITVPNGTTPGNYYVNVTLNWTNPDDSMSYNKTEINVTVASNPEINVLEENITSEGSDGTELYIGNFTVLSIGNDALQNISFSCYQGEVCNNFTIGFDPVNISSINVNENYSVAVIVTVPVSYPVGTYNGTVNVSAENDDYDTFILFITVPSETNLSITSSPSNYTVYNITQQDNETFGFTTNATNIGNGSAKYINVSLNVPSGWTPNSSLETCGNLTKNQNCFDAFNITVPNGTSPGNYYVNVTLNWTNPDGSMGTNVTSLNTTVSSTAVINVSETAVSGSAADGVDTYIGNFTVLSIGNDALQNISFSCYQGEVCNNFTIGFDPVNISSINVNENYSVAVIVTVPVSYPVGTYNGTVNVSAENDDYVNITLNVTVLSNRTWNMTPVYCEKNEDPLIGTACEIDVMNLGNDMINFTISPEEGNYTKVNETNFTVGMGLNYTFNITYNVSDVSYGIYNSSFVVNAVQSDANPDNMTLDVALLPYLPPIINLSIVPNFTDQNSTIEFFVNTTDRSGTNISWTNVTVTTPDSSSNQTTMSLVNTSGNFSQWYLNYTNDLGNTSLRGNYTVTVSAMDNVGNSGNLTENFTIYKKVLLTSTTLSSIYYQGDTGSIYYIIKNATGYGMNGIDVTFNIIDSNGNISYYSNYQTDSEGTISPMPTFTLTSDAPIGNYTLMANYSFYDDVLNQTLDVEDNNTFEVQSRTITVTGLFADLETAVVWYPDNEMRFGILVYNGEGRPVDPDDIILTVYRPDDLIYFSYGIGNMTKQSTGYYTFDYQMDYGTPPGMYLAVLNITQGQFNTAKIKAYRVSQGGPYDVRLSLFENEVPQGTYLDFAIIVENKGSVTQDVFIEYNITDLSGTSYFYQNEVIYHYYYGSEAVLTPAFTNQSFTRQAYVLSNQLEGSYILNAKVTYDYVQPPINANSTFSVIEGTTPEPAPSPTPGGQDTYYIRDETPEIAANILITDYNNNISLARGITRIEKVIVKNNGRVKLNNVSLFLLGIPTEWFSISPERYSTLTPDNSSVFLIEFDIPDNANVGNYKASILAVSGVVSNQKATEINIYSSIKELLENEIRRLEEELINLKVDVKIAEREGKDVSDISSIIETVESYIREAKEDIRNEELESALEKVSSATTLLRKAREFLDLLEIPIPEPFFSIWTILILLIVIIIIVFILVYLRKKKKLKPLLRPYMIHISKLTESVKRKEVDKPKLEEERDKLTRMLKVLEREKSEGMITTNAYNKMRKSLEKKLEEMNKKIR